MIETNTLHKYSSIQYSELIQLLNQVDRQKTSLLATPLFGTDGIRGCVGVDKLLNSSLAWQIGFWAGQTFRAQRSRLAPVILGQDSRNSSNMLSEALTKGFNCCGNRSLEFGFVSYSCGGSSYQGSSNNGRNHDFCQP